MATKSQKTKAQEKGVKKATEKLEISLRKKIKDFVLSLGHDAEEIGDEIKKTSKVLAKRLNRKLQEAKSTINKKVAKVKTTKNNVGKKADKAVEKAKKESKKIARKAASVQTIDVLPALKKEIKKEVKKASAKTLVKNKVPVKAGTVQTPAKKKVVAKETPFDQQQNAHPETPAPKKRQTVANRAPKSDPKPHNTDLPLEAGPRNKYKRG